MMNNRIAIILAAMILLSACNKQLEVDDTTSRVSMNLSINTLAASNDPASIGQDQTFKSLAIYIFRDDPQSTLERSALIPNFSPVISREIPIETTVGVKSLYVIVNYVGKTFRKTDGTPITLSETTTRQELENLTVESSGNLDPTQLIMVGIQNITLTSSSSGISIDVPMRRLQARVDVHLYKGENLIADILTLESITLYNKVQNSEVKFTSTNPQMLNSPSYSNQTIASSYIIPLLDLSAIFQPSDARAIFYSYQNIITSPSQSTTPYLEVKVRIAGIIDLLTYRAYITDNNQTTNKYSLLQNNVYQIKAILDIELKMVLLMNVLPWNTTNIEYERPVTSGDFTFDPFPNNWGGINGKTMNTTNGTPEDAVFKFELKAPIGAAWSATLTNGLDFAFTSSTAATPITAVSSGFTNLSNPAIIAVRALKGWKGDIRDTELYITVEGNEIAINPIVGLTRKYDGTATRIKIKQVASYN